MKLALDGALDALTASGAADIAVRVVTYDHGTGEPVRWQAVVSPRDRTAHAVGVGTGDTPTVALRVAANAFLTHHMQAELG